ncbi:MaoC/PaaZ C-terminal domain-containing protein [Desulfotruncus alcoholivorax]|uniref:MaoC/PaaZ C-terminal domain-containing protein n=1 Tax=Desulfotruncus alcoholivorax TaxID=265477 RepID=UPI00040A7658|nr:MaoC/PaaZ C-terminal domain-containing protein [Desulfotruncus alcoholivorax]
MLDKYFEDVEVGSIAVSRGRTITEADIVMFSAFSGDWYPLHTDKEYAANTMFGQRIAHGMLVLSVGTGLVTMEPGVVLAFYGMDKLRFTNPTFIGDTIRVETEVLEKKDKDSFGVITVKQEIKNQRDQVCCTAILKVAVNKKGTF